MGDRRGFTIIELLVVLSICAILFSLALPPIRNIKSKLLLSACLQGSVSGLRYTQSRAITSNQEQKWSISDYPPANDLKKGAIKLFSFSPSGFCPPGGSGTQLLENKKRFTPAFFAFL